MKKKRSIIIRLITAITILSMPFSSVFAATNNNSQTATLPSPGDYQITLNQSSTDYLKTLTTSGVIKEITTDSQGNIILKHNDSYLKANYKLTDAFIKQLDAAVTDVAARKERATVSTNTIANGATTLGTVSPMVYAKNWKVYFTHNEVDMYLESAAMAGTPALEIALDGMMTMIGGPVGTVISMILDIVGVSSMANLCYLIIQADYLDRGVYMGISWNGAFPNYTQGLW